MKRRCEIDGIVAELRAAAEDGIDATTHPAVPYKYVDLDKAIAIVQHAQKPAGKVSLWKCCQAVGQLFLRFRDDLAIRGHKAIYETYPSSEEIVRCVLDSAIEQGAVIAYDE